MKKILISLLFILSTITGPFLSMANADAAVSGWDAGYIMSDRIFTDSGSMGAGDIQAFLNSKVSSCDTNGTRPASEYGRSDLTHAQYAAMRGWSAPPYTCLKDYSEGGKTGA